MLQDLYIFFSRFVPLEVLKRNHIAGVGPDRGQEQLQQEVLNTESDERLAGLCDYLFLGDQDFVLERLRQSNGQLLMIDSDRIDYYPHRTEGAQMTLAITVAEHYNQSNASVVSELVVQQNCLATLMHILNRLEDHNCQRSCSDVEFRMPAELRFLDMRVLNGLIGYTAFLKVIG